jgi:arylsulfatase A-like enzyme
MIHRLSLRNSRCLGPLLSVLLAGNWTTAQTSGGVPPLNRPNVLLIVIDDLGIETLDFYDYNPDNHFCLSGNPPSPSLTPKLAALAQQGVVFRRAYGYPICNSSRAAILTGRHGLRTGMGEVNPDYDLPLSEVTIAEMLKGGFPASWPKYKCGAFGKWGVVHSDTADDDTNPIDQGFNRFVGYVQQLSDHYSWEKIDDYANPPGSLPDVSIDNRFSATAVRQDALTWIQSVSEPFFAYVCFSTPHGPYQVPPLETVSQETQDAITLGMYSPGDEPADASLVFLPRSGCNTD